MESVTINSLEVEFVTEYSLEVEYVTEYSLGICYGIFSRSAIFSRSGICYEYIL